MPCIQFTKVSIGYNLVLGVMNLSEVYIICLIVIPSYLPDMINMIRLGFVPHTACWIFSTGDAIEAVAVYVSKIMLLLQQLCLCALSLPICQKF